MGEKAQYTQKGHKTLKIGIFHSHPCGFYIKNRPFAIEMAVWGLGLLLFHLFCDAGAAARMLQDEPQPYQEVAV